VAEQKRQTVLAISSTSL